MSALQSGRVVSARIAVQLALCETRPGVRAAHLSDDVLSTALAVLQHYESLLYSPAYQAALSFADRVAAQELAQVVRREVAV